jgi:hypothetical protein
MTSLYAILGRSTPLTTVFGYETAAFRKTNGLPKTHDADALCIATLHLGARVPYHLENFYTVGFHPRQTRRQYHDLPRKGQGRIRYQMYKESEGFCKGDIVRVKGTWIKQIKSIYADGRLAFKRAKGEPPSARPQDCQLLERRCTTVWDQMV